MFESNYFQYLIYDNKMPAYLVLAGDVFAVAINEKTLSNIVLNVREEYRKKHGVYILPQIFEITKECKYHIKTEVILEEKRLVSEALAKGEL